MIELCKMLSTPPFDMLFLYTKKSVWNRKLHTAVSTRTRHTQVEILLAKIASTHVSNLISRKTRKMIFLCKTIKKISLRYFASLLVLTIGLFGTFPNYQQLSMLLSDEKCQKSDNFIAIYLKNYSWHRARGSWGDLDD